MLCWPASAFYGSGVRWQSQKRFVSPYYLFNKDEKTGSDNSADVTPALDDDKRSMAAYPRLCEVN